MSVTFGLSAHTVRSYLLGAGLITTADHVDVVELAGGVSNTVLGVASAAGTWVLKQSLQRLNVADEWLATQDRTITEAAALEFAHRVTPRHVPRVVHIDPAAFVLVIERAAEQYVPWKTQLLQGHANPDIGRSLGLVLGHWHRHFAHEDLAAIDSYEAFGQLRIDPYHRAVAARVPGTADAVDALVTRMAQRRFTMVHGDYSPKNVLVDPRGISGPMVIDFEVAHRGDPTFDVAFLLSHLVLKAVHRRIGAAAMIETGRAFRDAYQHVTGSVPWETETGHLQRHLGALLLARTDGKSPVDYLDAYQRDIARGLGRRLLLDPDDVDPLSVVEEELA